MDLAFRETGNGQPLLILHGLFGQSDNWNTIARNLAQENLRVFTIDQRNHGLSPHSAKWDYPSMADDLHEFIKRHELKDPIILGHSMGAKTAMFFEHQFPGISSKMIIADMSAREYEPHHQDVIEALNSVDFSKVKTRKEAEETLGKYLKDDGTKQFLLKNIYWKDESTLAWRFNLKAISENYDKIRTAVPFFKSDVPALIIRGGRSTYVKETDIEEFRKRFSNVQISTIDGAGHWVHAEKPNEFFKAVLEFIKA
jgi:esterase